jgi:hypothetical protein
MIMIGVATEQNTTNLIPAIYFKDAENNHFISVTTGKMKAYSAGLNALLQKSSFDNYEDIDVKDEDEANKIIDYLHQKVAVFDASQKVFWNIGGGQKKHTLALLEAYKKYSHVSTHLVCYIDQETRKIISYRYENEQLKQTLTPENGYFEIDIDTESLIQLYNRNKLSLTVASEPFDLPPDFTYSFETKNQRKKWFSLHKRRDEIRYFVENETLTWQDVEMFVKNPSLKNRIQIRIQEWCEKQTWWIAKNLQPNLLRNLPTMLNQIFGNKDKNSMIYDYLINTKFPPEEQTIMSLGTYFEFLVIQRIQEIESNIETNIHLRHRNFKVKEGTNQLVEFDILFQTKQAQLVYFEAKTFDWSRVDFLAKLQKNRIAGGVYVTMIAVIPYFKEDVMSGDIYTEKLLNLPFEFKKYNATFCVLAEDDQDFWVYKNNNKIMIAEQEPVDYTEKVKCQTIESYFRNPKNKLIKS